MKERIQGYGVCYGERSRVQIPDEPPFMFRPGSWGKGKQVIYLQNSQNRKKGKLDAA